MNFKEFTKINQIVKSVRFELKPIGETRAFLEKHGVIESDAIRKGNVKLVKEISDCFIKDFLQIIGPFDYDWSKLAALYGTSEYKSGAQAMKTKIAADITARFSEYVSSYVENNNCDKKVIWPGAGFIEVLLPIYASNIEKFCKSEYREALQSLEGASTALFKSNFYRYQHILSGTKHGSVAERALENFEILLINKMLYEKNANTLGLDTIFSSFSDVNTMNACIAQSGIDAYNMLIGAEYDKNGEAAFEGANQIVNKYNLANPDSKLPLFKQLYKQILIESAPAFNIETIENRNKFNEVMLDFREKELQFTDKIEALVSSIGNECSTVDVYVTVACRREISNALCDGWGNIDNILTDRLSRTIKDDYFARKNKVKTELTAKEVSEIRKQVNARSSSVAEINNILESFSDTTAENYIADMLIARKDVKQSAYSAMKACKFWNNDMKPQWEENASVQKYIDAAIDIAGMARYFVTDIAKIDCDVDFTEKADALKEDRKELTKLYNMIRNYLTKKPEQDAKKKSQLLMFGRPAHLDQKWQNRQAGKFGNPDAALLEYKGQYYYIVSGAEKQKLAIPLADEKEVGCEYYNYLATKKNIKLSMALPKLTFASKKALEGYKNAGSPDEEFEIPVGCSTMMVSEKMYTDYNAKTFRQDKDAKNALINFAKEFISKDSAFKSYDFSLLKEAEEYASYGEFCEAVDAIAFKVECKYISKEAVDRAVSEGKIYMFLITNQDMYKPREKCKDKTALRFRAIMERIFDGDTSIIINNAPQIQYRPAIIEEKDTHPVGSILVNKLTSDGRKIPDGIYKDLCDFYNGRTKVLSVDAQKYAGYAVIKKSDFQHIRNRHYTHEMFTIALSYTINKGVLSQKSAYELNSRVIESMNTQGYNVMSVIRGTDSLLYYYICDQDGKRISGGDFNTVGNVDFNERLTLLGDNRYAKQLKWDYSMGNTVANVKEEYIRQACNEIARIAVKNNAVIVVDLLSDKLKSHASHFDNKLYKKFEGLLVKVLADFSDTSLKDNEPGGVINPIQLASPENVKGYQNGIVFFVSAALTKGICPESGFANIFASYNVCTLQAKRKCLEHMKSIRYNKELGEFEYEFSFEDIGHYFSQDEVPEGLDHVWTIRTHSVRTTYNKCKRMYEQVDGTNMLREYMADAGIPLDRTVKVEVLDDNGVRTCFEVFLFYINGYAGKEDGKSVYVSPVTGWCNTGKVAFDEMTAKKLTEKAVMMIENIRCGAKGVEAVVSKTEWYECNVKNN